MSICLLFSFNVSLLKRLINQVIVETLEIIWEKLGSMGGGGGGKVHKVEHKNKKKQKKKTNKNINGRGKKNLGFHQKVTQLVLKLVCTLNY